MIFHLNPLIALFSSKKIIKVKKITVSSAASLLGLRVLKSANKADEKNSCLPNKNK